MLAHADVSRTGLNQRTLTPPIDPDELAADSPGDRGRPADAGASGGGRTFDLTNAFSVDGWYGDAYADLIPDRTDAVIVLGLVPGCSKKADAPAAPPKPAEPPSSR